MTRGSDTGTAPDLAVVAGNPSAEDIAALVIVMSARARPAAAAGAGETARSEWSARSRLLREPIARAPGGWRASALPR
jgi:Acyl-CoA carboxylase epsilon subunit